VPAVFRRSALADAALRSILAVALLVAPGAASAGAEPARPLRVVTFNVLHGGPKSGWTGDGVRLERRLAIAIEQLRAIDPDIVGLQEASAAWGRGNIARRIADALGLKHAWAPATSRVFVPPFGLLLTWLMNFVEGPAILSRYPILDAMPHELPHCMRRFDPRVALEARVQTPSGPVTVVSVHTSGDPCQLARVGELVRAGSDGAPAIVMGDFNAPEWSPDVVALTNDGFIDAFRAANPGVPGLTTWQRPTAPGPTVRRRVDYVFLRAGDRRIPRVRASRVVLDTARREPDGTTLWPSDHYGVLAEVELAPRDLEYRALDAGEGEPRSR
jgi:endonuclease/exonuclease/phosphatase family metal-dependent hydrolase